MSTEHEPLLALHRDHASALWGYVARLTRDPSRAEDIVQETMLRAWRQRVTDDATGSARAWLFTVARNLVIDDARSARARHESVAAEIPEVSELDRTDALFDEMLITDALLTLSDDHRAVVVRAYYRRQTVTEIADELGIPSGTVKSRLHYGLRGLRLALQERGVTR